MVQLTEASMRRSQHDIQGYLGIPEGCTNITNSKPKYTNIWRRTNFLHISWTVFGLQWSWKEMEESTLEDLFLCWDMQNQMLHLYHRGNNFCDCNILFAVTVACVTDFSPVCEKSTAILSSRATERTVQLLLGLSRNAYCCNAAFSNAKGKAGSFAFSRDYFIDSKRLADKVEGR